MDGKGLKLNKPTRDLLRENPKFITDLLGGRISPYTYKHGLGKHTAARVGQYALKQENYGLVVFNSRSQDEKFDYIEKLRSQGLTLAEIGQRLGVTSQAVSIMYRVRNKKAVRVKKTRNLATKTCIECGAPASTRNRKFCSRQCFQLHESKNWAKKSLTKHWDLTLKVLEDRKAKVTWNEIGHKYFTQFSDPTRSGANFMQKRVTQLSHFFPSEAFNFVFPRRSGETVDAGFDVLKMLRETDPTTL